MLSTQIEGARDECEWPSVWPVPKLPAEGSVDVAQVVDNQYAPMGKNGETYAFFCHFVGYLCGKYV